jgi:hypothetical protein
MKHVDGRNTYNHYVTVLRLISLQFLINLSPKLCLNTINTNFVLIFFTVSMKLSFHNILFLSCCRIQHACSIWTPVILAPSQSTKYSSLICWNTTVKAAVLHTYFTFYLTLAPVYTFLSVIYGMRARSSTKGLRRFWERGNKHSGLIN